MCTNVFRQLEKKLSTFVATQKKALFSFCEGQHVMGGGEF